MHANLMMFSPTKPIYFSLSYAFINHHQDKVSPLIFRRLMRIEKVVESCSHVTFSISSHNFLNFITYLIFVQNRNMPFVNLRREYS